MKLFYQGKVVPHGEQRAQQLKSYLQTNQGDWQHQLVPNLVYIDPRALNESGIDIQAVNYIGEKRYSLTYQYDWFVFSGCTDTDLKGTDTNKVTFELFDNGELVFDVTALGH
ncbi:hypothetical protein [Vibrio aphrogenes]|uniref:hypothetical protein n=1 Tax=Vibrio aphrogenes TaxID=1891186 RepID=UPI000B34E2C6|nr:hypothetical protein [Vibrio aphrogenes]